MCNCNTFNFVQSVKGGCGKTTFSIHLSSFFARREENDEKGLLIDVDLQGTSLQYLITGAKLAENKKCLQDAIEEPDAWTDCVDEPMILENFELPIIYSSIDPKVKKKFRVNAEHGYIPVIQHSIFNSSMMSLLKKFRESDNYNNFVFDMPPSSEGFSEIPLICTLANKNKEIVYDGDMVNLFYLTTLEAAQIKITADSIDDFLANLDTHVNYQVFIIFNNNYMLEEKRDFSELHENAIKNFMDFLKSGNVNFTEANLNKMYLCQMPLNESYTKKVIQDRGLLTINPSEGEEASAIIPRRPVTHVINLKELLQLSDGKNLRSIAKAVGEEEEFFIKLLRGEAI